MLSLASVHVGRTASVVGAAERKCGDGRLGRPAERSEALFCPLDSHLWLNRPLPHAELEYPVNTMRIPTANKLMLSMSLTLAIFFSPALRAQTAAPVDPKTVPVVDGGIGSCSVDFTVTDSSQAPVYAANIKVHIAYGFMYLRKLDLEVGTNASGKARFTGLPDRTKQGLFFQASEGAREGSAFVDPAKTCKADLTIALEKKPQ